MTSQVMVSMIFLANLCGEKRGNEDRNNLWR